MHAEGSEPGLGHDRLAEVRLGEAVRSHREEVLDQLASLPWSAEPATGAGLVEGSDQVRPRAELFLDSLLQGLIDGTWTDFDRLIARRTTELLVSEVISASQLNARALTMTGFLIPIVLGEPDPGPLLAALFKTMQVLGGQIVAGYNELLLIESRRLDDLKTMFLRMTGHELRAPLGTIRGYAEMLQDGDFGRIEEPATTAIDAIRSMSESALGMIERLGEVARLESSTEALHYERCRLDELVRSAVQPLKEAIRQKSVRLDTEAGGGDAVVDPDAIAIAIRNLLGNALKYGSGGGVIKLTARREGDDAVFEVADRGPGIPADQTALVFERYHQVKGGSRPEVPGTGLGLYIVRRIAELHGGEATVESRLGSGSTFRLRFPAVRDASAGASP